MMEEQIPNDNRKIWTKGRILALVSALAGVALGFVFAYQALFVSWDYLFPAFIVPAVILGFICRWNAGLYYLLFALSFSIVQIYRALAGRPITTDYLTFVLALVLTPVAYIGFKCLLATYAIVVVKVLGIKIVKSVRAS
jgi:hypothetical protein